MKSRSVSLRHPLGGLAGVVGQHAVQEVAHAEDLLGLELDVAGLALDAAERLVQEDPGVGEGEALALVPAPSSTAAAEAAWPKQNVDMSGLMYFMVS